MFDRTRPCGTCPFRVGVGSRYAMDDRRLDEIFAAHAFQCHKTIDYEHFDDPTLRQGDRPQQCAGLMALLVAEERPNQIMQVAMRLGAFDPQRLDRSACYDSFEAVRRAHRGEEP